MPKRGQNYFALPPSIFKSREGNYPKYLMADKKLRIPRKLKTETHKQLKIQTDMNSDAPYESAVRTSIIPLQGVIY
jgi:hypothetical protein